MSDDERRAKLSAHFEAIIRLLGEDPSREGLVKTPARAAKALMHLTMGYEQNIQTISNGAVFESAMDELVIVKDIELYSICEHHLLPFFGRCHVGYIPNGKVLGLSKIARIADVFARRLQIQENLTVQIANAIQELTNAKGVGVIIEASHMCMMMRGVEKQGSVMATSCMLGLLREDSRTRAEFLTLVSKQGR